MRNLILATTVLLTFGLALAPRPAQAQGAAPGSAPKPAAAAAQTPAAGGSKAPAASNAAPSPFQDDTARLSYALGMNLGVNFHRQEEPINAQLLFEGLQDGLSGGKTLMTEEEMTVALRQLQTEIRAKQEEKKKLLPEANRKAGEAFLAENKTKPGVVTLPSGLQYKVMTEGSGPKPGAEDTVVCNYRGTLIDGTEFDSSYKRGQPASFPVKGVIKGWTEALQLMSVGSKWQLFIPPDLAYGDRGAGDAIGPNATLVFEVELVSIRGKW